MSELTSPIVQQVAFAFVATALLAPLWLLAHRLGWTSSATTSSEPEFPRTLRLMGQGGDRELR